MVSGIGGPRISVRSPLRRTRRGRVGTLVQPRETPGPVLQSAPVQSVAGSVTSDDSCADARRRALDCMVVEMVRLRWAVIDTSIISASVFADGGRWNGIHSIEASCGAGKHMPVINTEPGDGGSGSRFLSTV